MTKRELMEEALSKSVIGAFYEVYNTLGYGYYEHFYTQALEIELNLRGHRVSREVRFPVLYKGHRLGTQRVDLVVDERLIVESKATQELHRGAPRQLFSYLHGSTFELGFVLHFGPEARFYPVVYRNEPQSRVSEPFAAAYGRKKARITESRNRSSRGDSGRRLSRIRWMSLKSRRENKMTPQ